MIKLIIFVIIFVLYSIAVFLCGRGYGNAENFDYIKNLKNEIMILRNDLSLRSVEDDEELQSRIDWLNKINEHKKKQFISVKSKAKMEFENMKDRFRDVNLNEHIKVKLTDKGKEIYREYLNDVLEEYEINDIPKIEVDEEGYTEFQLWDFMHIFGEHFCMGGDLPCVTDVKIQIREK